MKKDLIELPKFNGFYKETFTFFEKISKNNNLEWFREHKEEFEKYILNPSKALIVELSEFLKMNEISLRTEPKYDQTIMRIYKDQRFHKTNPLREYILIHFGRFKMDSELYVYLHSKALEIGVFLNLEDEKNYFLSNYKKNKKQVLDTLYDGNYKNNFTLYKLSKEIELIKTRFNPRKDMELLINQKMVLISKNLNLNSKLIYSKKLLIEVIKDFIILFPFLKMTYYKL